MKERTLPPSKSPVKWSTGGWEENTCLFGCYPLNLFTVLSITSKTKNLFIDLYLLDPVQVFFSPPFFFNGRARQGNRVGGGPIIVLRTYATTPQRET